MNSTTSASVEGVVPSLDIIIGTDTSAEILDNMAAALAHFVHNGVQIIQETVWKFVKFLKYNNQELMVPSALDRDIQC